MSERVTSAETAVADAVAAVAAPATSGGPSLLNLPLDVQPHATPGGPGRRCAAPAASRAAPDPGDVAALADAARAARRPVFIAGRGARAAPRRAGGARRRVRRAAGHLGRGERAVRRQPVVARRLRRLRLAAGRRADRGRRPDRRLGLRAEHVDDAARRAHRRRRDRRPGRPRRRARSAHTGRSTSAWSATSARRRARCARLAGCGDPRRSATGPPTLRERDRRGRSAGATCRTTDDSGDATGSTRGR